MADKRHLGPIKHEDAEPGDIYLWEDDKGNRYCGMQITLGNGFPSYPLVDSYDRYICREGQPYAMAGCMCSHCFNKPTNPQGNWQWLGEQSDAE